MTYEHPWYTAQQQQGSTTTSDVPLPQKQQKEQPGQTLTDKTRNNNLKGDYYEHYVMLKCWEKGAEVFKNASCQGKTDLILKYQGKVLEVDVKPRTHMNGADYKVKVPIIVVHPETKHIKWFRAPEGWEDFWK